MLEDLGHTGIPASSGQEALEILRRRGSVDMVVTDQAMPNMTGQQLAEEIQREWPGVPVILATGYAELKPGVKVDLQKLSKPFTQIDLAEELARVLPKLRNSGCVLKFRAGAIHSC
jgi:CheY-like chemotaxis protein